MDGEYDRGIKIFQKNIYEDGEYLAINGLWKIIIVRYFFILLGILLENRAIKNLQTINEQIQKNAQNYTTNLINESKSLLAFAH